VPTSASRAAQACFAANRAALATTQPSLTCAEVEVGEFLYGRDGMLTALEVDQSWHSGCSIPRRAAEAMLKSLKPTGPVAMLLVPFHAAAIRTALTKLDRSQAVIAVYPNDRDFQVALHCEDFAKEIARHRLWFVAGTGWTEQLTELFARYPGLPTPSYSIRLPATERAANELIPAIEQIVSAETQRRDALLTTMRTSSVKTNEIRRVCVVAPGEFRLWGDCGHALATALRDGADAEFMRFDPDDPAQSSPLALASAIAKCDALVTANLGRADFPNVVGDDVPWLTWVTTPRIPAAVKSSSRDGLVLADDGWKSAALAAGWNESQVALGGWPVRNTNAAGDATVVIADTRAVPTKADGFEYSSHGLLWSAIANELNENPFALSDSIENYLARRMKQLSIREEGFDRVRFIDELIIPAFGQGVVKAMVKQGISVELHGAGWDQIAGLEKFSRGTIETREQLDAALARASVLVHCLPLAFAHSMESAGRTVVRAFGQTREGFLREVQSINREAMIRRSPAISPEIVMRLLRG
jgi:hypothetical protein